MRSRTTIRIYGRAGKFLDLFAEYVGKPKSKIVDALLRAYHESVSADRKYVTSITVPADSDVAVNKALLMLLLDSIVSSRSANGLYEVKHGEGTVNHVYGDYVVIDGEKYFVHRSIKYMLSRIDEGDKVYFDYVEPPGRGYKRIIRLYVSETKNDEDSDESEIIESYEYGYEY